MGFLDRVFEKKICNVCGAPIDYFQNKKLQNGNCCKKCLSELSPWFSNLKASTVENIRYQLYCRKQNYEKLNAFNPTKVMGTEYKVLVDETKREFAVAKNGNYLQCKADIINCSDINRCTVDIIEHKKEVEYIDSNGEIHSFVPPYFAYSYDLFVEIGVTISYINVIRFKINPSPIDNGQEEVINIGQNGIINKFKDKMYTNRSYNGKTSNLEEVRASTSYKKYDSIANEIKDCLLYYKNQQMEIKNAEMSIIHCHWCNSKILKNSTSCNHCGGPI